MKTRLFTISRRGLLRILLLSGIAAWLGVINKTTEQVGFVNWFRWMARGRLSDFSRSKTRVALAACSSYDEDILTSLRPAWSLAGIPSMQNARVVLKPNLVDYTLDRPAFTHPRVTQAVIRVARESRAREVVVAEGPSFRRDPQAILDATGYTAMLAREQVEFVDLNHDDLVEIPLRGGYTQMDTLLIPKTVHDADYLISIPKLKTHHWSQISASVKNLFGIVPGIKYGWPKNTLHWQGIPACLMELLDSLPPRKLAVVDAVVGMEGDGPLFGSAVENGLIAAGTDLLAVDAACARLMGMDPTQMDYFRFAAWAGLGRVDAGRIDLVGESPERFRRQYARAPQF